MTRNQSNSLFGGVDRGAVLLYALIVIAGWISIAAATYDETVPHIFSFAHFYMKQMVWISVAWVVAL
ncbi:MAG: rod shape-determining protein RodA, partial [Alistipes sp.]|nr:rod shape-determining protein RodA [Alistipes sp.]